ncbi:ATP-binding protein [uncultured Maritimibacter sp.]|jgi:two-component system sensor histidine kinase HupT/HoxJ|uniref:sensor histidine kinase n=1 Tax=uncultured Maritimibacter sp. TaxID=991866 RepID=UPI000A96F4AA|nr:ATP-binding protein [uncultured Maritimibacter sp.]
MAHSGPHALLPPGTPGAALTDTAWVEVLAAVDKTYSELVAYQEELETRNAELDAMRRFMASVFASVSDLILVVDRDFRIEEASGSVAALLGADKLGTPVSALVTEADWPMVEAALRQACDQRRPTSIEAAFRSTDGETPIDLSIAPRIGDRGRTRGAVLTGRPLAELRRAYSKLADSHQQLKEAQTHLVRNEKLASLGRLLAGVAHELNNPISFVYANTHAMEKSARKLEQYFEAVQAGASRDELIALRESLRLDREMGNLRMALEGARDGAERVRDIVEDLRRLSADGTGEMAPFDLVTTAQAAVNWVRRGSKRDVRIVTSGLPEVIAVGRKGHIQQVLMNLFQNAIDAVEGVAAPEIGIEIGTVAREAFVRVTDNGPGVPPALAATIFDPFFTTKEVGKGTGLGLSISHKIAEEHGGSLTLDDACEGASFTLTLPAPEPRP